MIGPTISDETIEKLKRKDWFLRIATDADLGRPDRRLKLTEPDYSDACKCGCSHDKCECAEIEQYYKEHPEEMGDS